MATLYQRFNGKINTGNSFPKPAEASRLLGQDGGLDRAAETVRPRLQHPHSHSSEDEDVRTFPPARLVINIQNAPSSSPLLKKCLRKQLYNCGRDSFKGKLMQLLSESMQSLCR